MGFIWKVLIASQIKIMIGKWAFVYCTCTYNYKFSLSHFNGIGIKKNLAQEECDKYVAQWVRFLKDCL